MGVTIARIDLAHLRSSTRNLNRSPSFGPRMKATLWPSAICSSLPENFEREEGPHVVATIVSNDCMQDWYAAPLMPDLRTNLITCDVVCINETKFFFNLLLLVLILEFLYCFNWDWKLVFFSKYLQIQLNRWSICIHRILLGEFYLDIWIFFYLT